MAYSNGKITAPVAIADVRKALGASSSDLATLCSHPNINPAARFKPVRYNSPALLTDVQRRHNTDWPGYYYGLKMASSTFTSLHECDYSYLPVRPGADWSRLADFDGYDANAVFSPQGSVETPVYFIDGSVGLQVIITNDENNTTGVSLAELIANVNADENMTLGNSYPCILASDLAWSKNYVRAMFSYPTGGSFDDEEQTVMAPGGAWRSWWRVPDLPDALRDEPEVMITVFFIKEIDNALHSINVKGWTEFTPQSLMTLRGYTCPGLIARTVTLRRQNPLAYAVVDLSFSINNNRLEVAPVLETIDPVAGETYDIRLEIEFAPGDVSIHTFSVLYDPDRFMVMRSQATNKLVLGDTASGSYGCQWRVERGGVTLNSGYFSGTYNVGKRQLG